MLIFAQIFVAIGSAYLMTGLAVAIVFLLFWIERLDPASRTAFAFRPLLLPGLALLWPLVIAKMICTKSKHSVGNLRRRHKGAHRLVWIGLAGLIGGVFALAWSQRPTELPTSPSIRLGNVLHGSHTMMRNLISHHPREEKT